MLLPSLSQELDQCYSKAKAKSDAAAALMEGGKLSADVSQMHVCIIARPSTIRTLDVHQLHCFALYLRRTEHVGTVVGLCC